MLLSYNFAATNLTQLLTMLVIFSVVCGVLIMPLVLFFGGSKVFRKLLGIKLAKEKAIASTFSQYAASHSGSYTSGKSAMVVTSSIKGDLIHDVMQLGTNGGSTLWLYYMDFIRGASTNGHQDRTVIAVSVPDIMSHFVIKSRLNETSAKDFGLGGFSSSQEVKLEGDFSEYFKVLAPATDEKDLLVILSPNVMGYMLQNFANYDIEMVGNMLYIYSNSPLSPEVAVSLIEPVEELVRRMRLRSQDARASDIAGNSAPLVARAATDNYKRGRLVKSPWFYLSIFILPVSYFLMPFSKNNFLFYFIPVMVISMLATVIKTYKQSKLHDRYAERQASDKTPQKPAAS